jgi:tetratricopeptide (TPR) repeat protein
VLFTFAELLRSYRERASLDRAALAAALGVHRNTLGLWERGEYRPRYRELLLRLADELALSPAETDQLLRAADFPPVNATPDLLSARHQLRAPLADFVGRVQEIEQLRAALQAESASALICNVRSMSGIGKTELAYHVAHQLRRDFPDGQFVLALGGSSLAPLTPEQALQTVIRAFRPEAKLPENLRELEPLYRSLLHEQRALILADDAGDASQVRALLPPSGCALLVTSRVRFSLPAMTTLDLETLSEPEAVMLLHSLCERLSEKEAQALARACGCLPLALRVGGSLLHNDVALSVATYLRSLMDERQRLALLRDEDDGQLDVAATLALSYAQLEREAQHVFRQLGVLVADFTVELAQAVVAAPAGVDVAATLRLLLRRNLVMYDVERGRWRLHDLLRYLARRELERVSEREPTMWRYAQAALQIAQETQEQYLAGGEGVLVALSRFDAERAHIGAARRWATIHARTLDGDRLLLEVALATRYIGYLRSDARGERIPLWERALAAAQRLGNRQAQRSAMNNLGLAYRQLGESQTTISYLEQALALARELGDRYNEGVALGNLGAAYADLGESQTTISYLEQALALAHELGDREGEGVALGNLGNAYYKLGRARRAIPYFEQSLAIAREIGDRRGEGAALHNLGNTYTDLGDTWRAVESCQESLTIACAIGDREMEGVALGYLAYALAIQGDVSRATAAFEQALALFRALGGLGNEAECNWLFGLALARQGQRGEALPLLRAAVAYDQEIGHTKAAEHAALVARLETGEDLPPELLNPAGQRAVGDDEEPSTDDNPPP